jgi:hypothetical protein
VCQSLLLVRTGALVRIGPEAARRLSGEHAGWGFLIVCALFCVSFVLKGAVARFAHAAPFSSKVCGFRAGGALLGMSMLSLVAPPRECSQLTAQMVLGLLLVVSPLADQMEKRRRQWDA